MGGWVAVRACVGGGGVRACNTCNTYTYILDKQLLVQYGVLFSQPLRNKDGWGMLPVTLRYTCVDVVEKRPF